MTRGQGKSFKHNTVPAVKYGGGSSMLWGYFGEWNFQNIFKLFKSTERWLNFQPIAYSDRTVIPNTELVDLKLIKTNSKKHFKIPYLKSTEICGLYWKYGFIPASINSTKNSGQTFNQNYTKKRLQMVCSFLWDIWTEDAKKKFKLVYSVLILKNL